jgi:anti-repressor protein
MNEIQVFNFNSNSVRVVVREGEPWFVAKDVAEVLGYNNPRDAIREHCKHAISGGVVFSDAIGREQAYTIIPERDVYRLIMRSKLPGAERFEEWVVGEVLPSIRKHGAYLSPDKIEEVLSDPDTIIRLATTLKQEKEQRAIAEAERDKAIREKAWISEKREATAMGKLSAAVKKINTLEDKLGEGKKWKSVRAIKWLP